MKKQLLLFAILLLISAAMKAQIIDVSTESLTDFTYAEGHGPSAPQSFTISVSELTEGINISFQGFQSSYFEISREEGGDFENQLSIPIGELEDGVEVFVRLKEGLTPDSYLNTIRITSSGATTKTVRCSGMVNGAVSMPQFTPDGGNSQGPVTVTITCDEGATIYYTTDGENPNENSNLYEPNEEILIEKTTTLKAIGIKDNWNDSDIANSEFHILYHIHATISPTESGEIIYNGQYMAYLDGDIDSEVGSITLQANPKNNYSFEYWTANNDTVNESSCEIQVDKAYNLIAHFRINNGNINTNVYPDGAGYVNIESSYEIGQTATLIAIPNPCYIFKQWNDGVIDNPRNIEVAQTNDYTAIFELANYTIIGLPNDESWGSVIGGGTTFHCEDVAPLEAIPEEGYEFEKWDDDNTDNPRSVIVNSDSTFTAIFTAKSIRINVIADPIEGGIVSGEGDYYFWETCTVTAQANESYSFIHWTEEDVIVSTESSFSFQPGWNHDRTFVAHFAQIPIVGIIETPATICDNESLDLVMPECVNTIGGEWQLSPDTTFTNIIIYDGERLSQSYDDWYLRYTAYNETDSVPSNIVSISVQSYISENEVNHQLVAKGPERGKYLLIYPNPKEGFIYQWYRDNEPIPNANMQYYYEQGGLTNGDYKVYISYTEDGTCGAFSPAKTISNNGSISFSIYPNPAHANDNLFVMNDSESEMQFFLYSIDGKLLHSQTVTASPTAITVHLSQGIYVAYLFDETGFVKVEKIVIQ